MRAYDRSNRARIVSSLDVHSCKSLMSTLRVKETSERMSRMRRVRHVNRTWGHA